MNIAIFLWTSILVQDIADEHSKNGRKTSDYWPHEIIEFREIR